ncbi:M6 family metalloprotease domain-containing protein [Solirubrobacter soli]|uniref:M6 family metalloprotease domain-containing protein n=1 Tax=Solirubrobacter soli TaxID=363832 RepID=UPI0004136F0C|nr:M6 family metalloprotease domain-containing protein [Solirubrobacter soli]
MRGKYVAGLATALALGTPALAVAGPPAPVDAQNWTFQDNFTWNDYHPIPGKDYSDPSIQPTVKKWKVALVLTDFPDKTFFVSQPAGSTIYGTPTIEAHDIPRADVPAFYRDFLNKPQPLNHFQTMNRYWMEDSYGKYGVQLDSFGPYKLPGNSYQYFLTDQQGAANNPAHCPQLTPAKPCNLNFRTDARAAWLADVGAAKIAEYDNIFYVSAGEDESSTWQEFGEMKFLTQNDVTDAFGPKAYGDLNQTNWAVSRYVPWSSWVTVANIWPNASGNTSVEGESSGMGTYAHELTHNLGLPDNYNNPFTSPYQRTATGMWDMMSRGQFNGAGGQHTRYLIPPTTGSALGSQHNMRNKRFLNFLTDNDILRLNRDGLKSSGMAVADVTAREVAPTTGEISGVTIVLDGAGDTGAPCDYVQNPYCDGVRTQANGTITGKYNNFHMEVVQQIGSDSFDPGHGVLISKSKNTASSCGNFSCFVWFIDAHPEDINRVDYIGPDGQPRLATPGDERQKNDATFNAGTNSGTLSEYEDTANRLHFYILDKRTDAQGVLHYKVGVRSLDGSGPQTRGVALASPQLGNAEGYATCTFDLKNTGAMAAVPNVHPQDASAYLDSDIYRLSASATGTGWSAYLKNQFASAEFGQSVSVPVYIEKGTGAGTVTLNAVSESDPSKTASAVCTLADGTVGGAVPATLALTMGAPASFGGFTPGLGKDYFASTTATVVSTAGDATLTVADPSATANGHLVNGTFSLPQALQASGSTSGTYAALPTALKAYNGPVSNDVVPVSFKQTIGANDALRTGAYTKTLTFTLSTTTP